MPSRRFAVLAVLLSVACGGAPDVPDAGVGDGGGADAPSATVPRFEPTACRFDVPAEGGVEGRDYHCGDLVVFEDREAPGRTLRLHVFRLPSSAATGRATLYLDGGPGANGGAFVWYLATDPALRAGMSSDGDVLVLAQRGTSLSVPSLAGELPDGVDLGAFHTAANADDVDELRSTLGYDQLNLFGISYGTRLGLEVLRRHPTRVRAAILDGVAPPQVNWAAEVPRSAERAFAALDASCGRDGGCGAAFPSPTDDFFAGIAALDAAPLELALTAGPLEIDGTFYAELVYGLLYARVTYGYLPWILHDLADGAPTAEVRDVLVAWLDELLAPSDDSEGLFLAIECGELFHPPAPGALEAATAGVDPRFVALYSSDYLGLVERCADWPLGPPRPELSAPVSSDVPTLLDSGALDPITPAPFAALAATTLSRATLVVSADAGHGALMQSPCGNGLLLSFLADPTATLDASCAAALRTEYLVPELSPRLSPARAPRIPPPLGPAETHARARLRRHRH